LSHMYKVQTHVVILLFNKVLSTVYIKWSIFSSTWSPNLKSYYGNLKIPLFQCATKSVLVLLGAKY
jgi:hypothetical protein